MLGRVFKLRPDMLSLIESDVDSGQAAAIVFRKTTGSGVPGAHRMIMTREAYVDGVSQVLVTGKVSRVNARNGSVQIGKVQSTTVTCSRVDRLSWRLTIR